MVGRGAVPDRLLELVDYEAADLVVMAAHGFGGIRRMLFGSVASRLIQNTPVPVIVVKYAALKKLAGEALDASIGGR